MDVLRLDTATFLPDLLIEGYTSMIWTERYIGNGEFELTTGAVFETLDILPEGCFITLRDSVEIMMVESRSVSVDVDGIMELKVTGRSFETFIENRALLPIVYGEFYKVYKPYTLAVMACALLWTYMVNTTVEDPTKPSGNFIDNYLAVPNVVVTDSTTYAESAKSWWVEAGDVYTKIQDFLALRGFGLRTIRPNSATGTVVTFNTSTVAASRGLVTRTVTNNISQLRLDVYQGLDRSHNQTARPSVIFHYDSGHIENPSYLFSIQDYRVMVAIITSTGSMEIWKEDATPGDKTASGLNRRILFMDGGSNSNQPPQDFIEATTQKAQIELQKHPKVRLFDGAISPISPYIYRKDYFLGDLVTVIAKFGFTEVMFVNEYIRTQDADGDRGYPGLLSL